MKRNLHWLTLFSLIFCVVACSDASSQTNLTLDAFVNKYKLTKGGQLLDVRTPNEWAAGHIASSHRINFNDPTFAQQVEKLDKAKPVFVYCAVGGRSSAAVPVLKKAGFKEVYNLQAAGYNELASKGIK